MICMHRLLVAATLLPGCFWASTKSDSAVGYEGRVALDTHGHVQGGAVHYLVGFAGLYADAEANVQGVTRPMDGDTYRDAGVGISVRASLLGIVASEHVLERYLDFGADGGLGLGLVLGVPPHDIGLAASAWVGGWFEIGTMNVAGGYLALTGNVRRETLTSSWNDQTQLMIGVAWRTRSKVEASDIAWHD